MKKVLCLLAFLIAASPAAQAGNLALEQPCCSTPNERGPRSGAVVRTPQQSRSQTSIAQATIRRPIVAVFDVQAKLMQLPKARQELLTSLLAEELAIGGTFQVMPPGDVKRALVEQSAESYKECYDEKCQIALGRQLPANKLLTCTVMKMGKKCRVSASLYDLKRQTTDTTEKVRGGCSQGELLESVVTVATKLRAWATGDTASDVSLPTVDEGTQPAPDSSGKDYKRDLAQAWRKLAQNARKGTTEQKLEKYQAFLADFPTDNPHAAEVQKNIDALERQLEKQEQARIKAEDKKAALAAKRQRSKELNAAYQAAKATKGGAPEKLAAWKKFLTDYPDDNPYAKTAQRKIKGFQAKMDRGISKYAKNNFDMGIKYKQGTDVPQDNEKASQLFSKACDGGYLKGCIELGRQYDHGLGVPRDPKKVSQLNRKACDGGDLEGCVLLGENYWYGTGVPKDQNKMFELYRKACDGGSMWGCSVLARSLYNTNGQRTPEANKFHRKACDGGVIFECSTLGVSYWHGNGVAKDLGKATELFRKTCGADEPMGCYFLATAYKKGKGVEKDIKKGNQLMQKACDGGHFYACQEVKNQQ